VNEDDVLLLSALHQSHLCLKSPPEFRSILSFSDTTTSRAATLMHLTAIAEQFDRLKNEHEDDLLSFFDNQDIKGMYDVRTYIAHDYEGTTLLSSKGSSEMGERSSNDNVKDLCISYPDER